MDKEAKLLEFDKWLDESYCLEAVRQNGIALRYVRDQTEEICLEAVKRDGYALRYVRDKNTYIKIIESE